MDYCEYSLSEIIRDPGLRVYENFEMSSDGHFYLYLYDADEGIFYRATVPGGAAAPHYTSLNPPEKVPLGGWYEVAKKSRAPFRLHLVGKEEASSAA